MGKLLEKMTEEGKLVEGELDGPHWEDQWWIGAKSYVRNTLYTGVIYIAVISFMMLSDKYFHIID